MQENTTLASETKQPHPGAASAPPGPGSRAEGKAESAPVPLRGNSPTPPKNKIKQPKENPKKGEEKKNHHLSPRGWKILWESVRMKGACGSGRLPLLPLRASIHPLLHPSRAGQPWSSSRAQPGAGTARTTHRSKVTVSPCPAVLPCSVLGWAPGGWGSHCCSAQPCLNSLSLVIRLKANRNKSKHKFQQTHL